MMPSFTSPPTMPSLDTTTHPPMSNFNQKSFSPPTLPPVREKPMDDSADKKAEVAEKKKTVDSKPAPKKGSWFGGIFSKMIKPNNQVHLPDDQPGNESIVFNEASGKWENKDGDNDSVAPAAPPPMDPQFSAQPNAPPTNFRAGLTKKRGARGYVDILGQSGMSKPVADGTVLLPNNMPTSISQPPPSLMNPNQPPSDGPTSLQTDTSDPAPSSMPMMFNPGFMGAMGPDQPPGF